MNVFYTSDLHLGHANIIAYANRPWLKEGDLVDWTGEGKPHWVSNAIREARAERMTYSLIGEINMRCKEEDTLISFGDFCCYGNEKGVAGVKTKAREWEEKIKPKVIHVLGNHDKQNTVKSNIESIMLRMAHLNVLGCHHPSYLDERVLAPRKIDAIVCGHVHEKWDVLPVTDKRNVWGVPLINVGVEVRNYRPVKHQELVRLVIQAVKGKR